MLMNTRPTTECPSPLGFRRVEPDPADKFHTKSLLYRAVAAVSIGRGLDSATKQSGGDDRKLLPIVDPGALHIRHGVADPGDTAGQKLFGLYADT